MLHSPHQCVVARLILKPVEIYEENDEAGQHKQTINMFSIKSYDYNEYDSSDYEGNEYDVESWMAGTTGSFRF